jgi:hypothetical protein
MRTTIRTVLAAGAVSLLALGACGDDAAGTAEDALEDAREQARDTAQEAQRRAAKAAARGQAEILRQRIRDHADGDRAMWRDVELLRRSARDLPGNPTVSGIEDTTGDGKDDDGRLEVIVEEQRACVRITDRDIEVTTGRC